MLNLLLTLAATLEPSVAAHQEPGSEATTGQPIRFSAPRRLRADGEVIQTQSPGYATPCLFDLDGDGDRDLIVGQFSGGRMRVYPAQAEGRFGPGEWLMAGGEVAEVPGVW